MWHFPIVKKIEPIDYHKRREHCSKRTFLLNFCEPKPEKEGGTSIYNQSIKDIQGNQEIPKHEDTSMMIDIFFPRRIRLSGRLLSISLRSFVAYRQ
jgi:hypothetical protein